MTEHSPTPDVDPPDSDGVVDTETEVAPGAVDDPPGTSYYCEVCDQSFTGPFAQQRYAGHHQSRAHRMNAGQSESESASESASTSATTTSSRSSSSSGVVGLSSTLGLYRLLSTRASQMGLPDGPTEESTDYDGVFSYAVEWHAFFFGTAMGLWVGHDQVTALPVAVGLIMAAFGAEVVGRASNRVPEYIRREIQKELHYFVGGVLVGYIIILYLHGETPPLPDWLPFQGHH